MRPHFHLPVLCLSALVLTACGGAPAAESATTAAEGSESAAAAATGERLNPMIALHEAGEPIFGLYAPANRRARPGQDAPPVKSPAELAAETLGFERSDFVFDGSMEGGIEGAIETWQAYVSALADQGATVRTHPLVVKAPKISDDWDGATAAIGAQLATGVSAIMFVEVESAEEVRHGLAAMRLPENGGTRTADVGTAPAYWGLSEALYRERADLWPLDPSGELLNWTIVESHEGLENVREIAAVEGIGVLWPGAGTLRRLFSEVGPDGSRTLDEEAWEAAIQKVLAACLEFDVPCGYPANADDVEERMAQGFSVFVMGWGEGGFATIDLGRRIAGR